MANHVSAKKRHRQSLKRRDHNRALISRSRTLVKKTLSAADKEAATPVFRDAVASLDKLAKKGLVHKKFAARHKSRLAVHLNTMS